MRSSTDGINPSAEGDLVSAKSITTLCLDNDWLILGGKKKSVARPRLNPGSSLMPTAEDTQRGQAQPGYHGVLSLPIVLHSQDPAVIA